MFWIYSMFKKFFRPKKRLRTPNFEKQLNLDAKRALLELAFLLQKLRKGEPKRFPKVLVASKGFCNAARYNSIFRLCMQAECRKFFGFSVPCTSIISGISVSLKQLSKGTKLSDLTFEPVKIGLSKKMQLAKLVSLVTGKVGLSIKLRSYQASKLVETFWAQLSELVCQTFAINDNLPVKNFDFLRVYGKWGMNGFQKVLQHSAKHLWLDVGGQATVDVNTKLRVGQIDSCTLCTPIINISPVAHLIVNNCRGLRYLEINNSTKIAQLLTTNGLIDRIVQLYNLYNQVVRVSRQKVSDSKVFDSKAPKLKVSVLADFVGKEFQLEEVWMGVLLLNMLFLRGDLVDHEITINDEDVSTRLSAKQEDQNVDGEFLVNLQYKHGSNTMDRFIGTSFMDRLIQSLAEHATNYEPILHH